MKKLLSTLFLLLFTLTIQANDNDPTPLAQAEKWLSTANEKGFLENKGQMMDNEGNPVPQVLFKTEAPDLNIWITKSGLTIQTLRLRKEPIPENELSEFEKEEVKRTGKAKTKKYFDWERVDIDLKGATINKENILKENPLQGHNNYFYPTCPDGIYGVKEYEKITIKDVYPGIDWVLYRNKDKGFKYDFVVHPEADYQQIELIYKSKTPIKINEQGELEMFTIYGKVKENKPVSFYENREIITRFTQNYQKHSTINGDKGFETSISFNTTLNFELRTSNLIIDPQLTWATFYGGNGWEGPMSIDTDNSGNVFVTGYTYLTTFPAHDTGTFFQGTSAGFEDVFILKFNNNGNRLWATYYGGSWDDRSSSITTDNNGNIFVTGWANSTNFPIQNVGSFFQGANAGYSDVFILKFDNTGNRLWATYYGEDGGELGYSITTDNNGNAFITGHTESVNFPIQSAGTFFQGTFNGGSNDAFILKFDNAGNLLWATYYGGSGNDQGYSIVTDASGNVFVTGSTDSPNFPVQTAGTFFQGTNAGSNDAFILKFDNAGNRLWATYYGGSESDYGYSIATDNSGNVFVTGATSSTNFPIQNFGTFFQGTFGGGYTDVYMLKFGNNGNRLWATYYGGIGNEVGNSIATDNSGNVFVTGYTTSTNFPIQNIGTFFQGTKAGSDDAFLLKFDNLGNRLWATYYGGTADDAGNSIAIDNNGNVFVTGSTTSSNFPIQNAGTYFQGMTLPSYAIFILKFDNNGNRLWATYYGGIGNDNQGTYDNLAITSCGNVYMSFRTTSTDMTFQPPCDLGGYFKNTFGGSYDIFLVLFSNIGNLLWSTYIGGDGNDAREALALDTNDNLFMAGEWTSVINSSTYPVTNSGSWEYYDGTFNGGLDDGYILKFCSNACLCSPYNGCIICIEDSFTQNIVICQGDTVSVGTNNYTTTGSFIDTLTNSLGCDSIITTNLIINPAPQFTLIKEDDNCGEQVGSVFVNVTSSIPPLSYIWNTGSNDSIINNLPAGTYTVIVNDGSGCSNTNTTSVLDLKLDCEFFIFIPNVFSPNADGQNDEFIIQLKGLEFISLEIYNRWGMKLFESTQKNSGWDGRTETGSKSTDGTYYFILNYKKADEKLTKKGTLTLLR